MKQSRVNKKPTSTERGAALKARTPGGPLQWTLRSRPRTGNAVLAMQSANCSSCFPAGTLVTMADGALLRIETVSVGDWVMGLSGPVQVWGREVPMLGRRPLLRFADGSLHWSAEHAFWVKRGEQQWLGSHDTEQWAYEVSMGVMPGLTSGKLWDLQPNSEWYAHASGWKQQRAQGAPAPRNLELFHLKTTGCHTLMVNGYVAGGGINDSDFDYTAAAWSGIDAVLGATTA